MPNAIDELGAKVEAAVRSNPHLTENVGTICGFIANGAAVEGVKSLIWISLQQAYIAGRRSVFREMIDKIEDKTL